MARPRKVGLLFFPLDTDFFYSDRRIRALRMKFGSDGIVLYIYLLTEIYREGYYIPWNSDSIDNAVDELGFTEELVNQIMEFLFSRSLFTKIDRSGNKENVGEAYTCDPADVDANIDPNTVITSSGIQKRYQEASKGLRRNIKVDKDIWLLDENETASFITVSECDKCSKNPSKQEFMQEKPSMTGVYTGETLQESGLYGKNPLKENKVKESKVKESKVKESAAKTQQPTASQMIDERSFSAEVDASVREWVKYKIEKRQGYKTTGLRNFLSQVENNVKKYGEKPVVELIGYCMSQNWQGVIWDRLAKTQRTVPQTGVDENGTQWPVIGGVDWSKV